MALTMDLPREVPHLECQGSTDNKRPVCTPSPALSRLEHLKHVGLFEEESGHVGNALDRLFEGNQLGLFVKDPDLGYGQSNHQVDHNDWHGDEEGQEENLEIKKEKSWLRIRNSGL